MRTNQAEINKLAEKEIYFNSVGTQDYKVERI